MKTKHISTVSMAMAVTLMLTSCGVSSVGNGLVNVKLTDAPGDFESVNVTIDEILVHRTGSNDEDTEEGTKGWISLVKPAKEFNLLELQNGVTAALGDKEIEEGNYNQIRFIVSAANVVTDSTTYNLDIPSGENSGLKISYKFVVEADEEYEIVLDFDAAESIKTSKDGYKMSPSIKVKDFAKGKAKSE